MILQILSVAVFVSGFVECLVLASVAVHDLENGCGRERGLQDSMRCVPSICRQAHWQPAGVVS